MLRDGLGKIGASARGQRGHLLCWWCGQSEKEGRAELRDSKDLKEFSVAKEKTKKVHQPRYNCLAKETTEFMPSLKMREGRGEKRNNTQMQTHMYIGIS